ncbi:hypothetical protein OIO90_006399 [Microbotryomycetes sp. JL221]|nr:hypothetical protein OIO90_006399 [Microbotryomycetes sp. JL221]
MWPLDSTVSTTPTSDGLTSKTSLGASTSLSGSTTGIVRSSLTLSRPVDDDGSNGQGVINDEAGQIDRTQQRRRSVKTKTITTSNDDHDNDSNLATRARPLDSSSFNQQSSGLDQRTTGLSATDNQSLELLTVLTAHDGESIMTLCVDDGNQDDDDTDDQDNHDAHVDQTSDKPSTATIYAGSQGGDIHVWDLATLRLRGRLTGHTGAVLALQLVKSRHWLISSSGDGTVRVWHTTTMTPLYLVQPPHDNIGDVLSIQWVSSELLASDQHHHRYSYANGGGQGSSKSVKGKGRLYAGCQDTSIMWIDLPPSFHLEALSTVPLGSPLATILSSSPGHSSPPIHRTPNRFFDSLTSLDRVRSRGGGGGGGSGAPLTRNGSSSTSLNTLKDQHFVEGIVVAGEFGSKSISSGAVGGGGGQTPPTDFSHGGDQHVIELQFQLSSVTTCAHYGYVLMSMQLSTAGDERLKVWRMQQHELELVTTLESTSDAVLTVATRDSTVFAGHQGGVVKIWDLDTFTCVRNLRPHGHDILTLTVSGDFLYAGSGDGTVQRWDKAFNLVSSWTAHDGIALSSCITPTTSSNMSSVATTRRKSRVRGGTKLLTGGNDNIVRLWDARDDETRSSDEGLTKGFQGELFHRLAKFVAYRSVSSDETKREECRQAAQYLKRVLRELGAETKLLPGATGRNPLVLATFRANAHSLSTHPNGPSRPSPLAPPAAPPNKRVLFYGHYDVVSATEPSAWSNSDPFRLLGKDGWLYGRGVTDNKGPILAVAGAASELKAQGKLDVDVVMLIEGEEESGSEGFREAVRDFKDLIGPIDVILVSNSYWIGEDIPCLTFGLRGVIHATLKIVSDQPDLHSGMQGGVVSEPLVDMVRLLASLTDAQGRVLIPGFLDDVSKLSGPESALYDAVVERCSNDKNDKLRKHSHVADPKQSLLSRWREPALSIHDVRSAGPSSKSLIPSWASATVSIRIVPDQSLETIAQRLRQHLQTSFAGLRTVNQLEIDIPHVADWWLGDIASPYFTALASCIEQIWHTKPLFIREGGSIPSLPFLEREFQADAVHFPMGTSEDRAHLADERIRVVNLENGKTIVGRWLQRLGSM